MERGRHLEDDQDEGPGELPEPLVPDQLGYAVAVVVVGDHLARRAALLRRLRPLAARARRNVHARFLQEALARVHQVLPKAVLWHRISCFGRCLQINTVWRLLVPLTARRTLVRHFCLLCALAVAELISPNLCRNGNSFTFTRSVERETNKNYFFHICFPASPLLLTHHILFSLLCCFHHLKQ